MKNQKVWSISEAKNVNTKNQKVVLITGVSGQDGSHMVDYLLKTTDHIIFGGVRRLSVQNYENLEHISSSRFHLVNFDLTDSTSISSLLQAINPDYFINFAAQSYVASSWDFALQTWETNTTGVLNSLEAIRLYCPQCRFYNAGSSEEFGNISYTPQDENHPLKPRSPYGASKAAARQLVKVYRESYNLYAVQGWLFNHEGERRGYEFVTRKITQGVTRIYKELLDGKTVTPIELGNVNARRDWSYAGDFVEGVWMMMNQEIYNKSLNEKYFEEYPELYNDEENKKQMTEWQSKHIKDYVLSSNETHSIREFVELAFKYVGIRGNWHREGVNEIFSNEYYGVLLQINPAFYRPAEVDILLGNSNLARNELGWAPKTSFDELVKMMVKSDLLKEDVHFSDEI